ncbi:MAG: DegT/DnrJ/EryC1/StrS aminotransferase, partial [Methanobacterium sp. 42_16]
TDIITNNTFWLGVYPGLNQDMLDYMLKVIHDFLSQY